MCTPGQSFSLYCQRKRGRESGWESLLFLFETGRGVYIQAWARRLERFFRISWRRPGLKPIGFYRLFSCLLRSLCVRGTHSRFFRDFFSNVPLPLSSRMICPTRSRVNHLPRVIFRTTRNFLYFNTYIYYILYMFLIVYTNLSFLLNWHIQHYYVCGYQFLLISNFIILVIILFPLIADINYYQIKKDFIMLYIILTVNHLIARAPRSSLANILQSNILYDCTHNVMKRSKHTYYIVCRLRTCLRYT